MEVKKLFQQQFVKSRHLLRQHRLVPDQSWYLIFSPHSTVLFGVNCKLSATNLSATPTWKCSLAELDSQIKVQQWGSEYRTFELQKNSNHRFQWESEKWKHLNSEFLLVGYHMVHYSDAKYHCTRYLNTRPLTKWWSEYWTTMVFQFDMSTFIYTNKFNQ